MSQNNVTGNTTDSSNMSNGQSFTEMLIGRPEWIVAHIIRRWVTIAVSSIGIFTNTLTVGVLCRSTMPKTSCTLIIICLAVFDGMACVCNTLYLMNNFYLDWILDSQAWCKIINLGTSWFEVGSVWILVAVTAERFVAVRFPLRVSTICTRKNAIVTLTVIILVSLLTSIYAPVFMIKAPDHDGCIFDSQYTHFIFVYTWTVVNTLNSYIPMLLICIFNVGIIHAMKKAGKMQTKISTASSSQSVSMSRQITRMCVAVSVTFIVCILPITVASPVYHFLVDFNDPVGYATLTLLSYLSWLLLTFNHTINFFLYIITGKRFRREFKSAVLCRRQLTPYENSTTKATSAALSTTVV